MHIDDISPIRIRRNQVYPTRQQEEALMARIQEGHDKGAYDDLFAYYSNFAISYIMKHTSIATRTNHMTDLKAAAAIGLWSAALKYDVTKGTRYTTIAFWYLKKYINEFKYTLYDECERGWISNSMYSSVAMNEIESIAYGVDEYDEYDHEHSAWTVQDIIEKADLTPTELYVINRLYLEDEGHVTYRMVAEDLGITLQGLRTIRRSAERKMKEVRNEEY